MHQSTAFLYNNIFLQLLDTDFNVISHWRRNVSRLPKRQSSLSFLKKKTEILSISLQNCILFSSFQLSLPRRIRFPFRLSFMPGRRYVSHLFLGNNLKTNSSALHGKFGSTVYQAFVPLLGLALPCVSLGCLFFLSIFVPGPSRIRRRVDRSQTLFRSAVVSEENFYLLLWVVDLDLALIYFLEYKLLFEHL